MIKFLGFAPDLDATTPGIITDCTNLSPTINGIKGAASGNDVGMDALAASPLAATVLIKLDLSNRLFAGTTTKLYEKSGTTWVDRSRTTAATATMTIAAPAVVTWTAHGLLAGTTVIFTTTGALPTGVVSATTYYVISAGLSANEFQFSATSGGAAITTSGSQSGTHTATGVTPAYGAGLTYPWRFAQFGNTSLAVSKDNVLQSSSSGAFANLTAPKANVICVSNGFVLLGNTSDATYGDTTNRWWCSALYDETDWVPNISTQCTTGQLVDTPGPITGMKPLGQYVVLYKEKSLYLGSYSGPPGVWDFQLLDSEIGCASHDAIADIESAHIFIGASDFYRFDGQRPIAIGSPLRKWFFNDLDPQYISRVKSSVDSVNSLVYFNYPRIGSVGLLTGCVIYNYKTQGWGVAHRSILASLDYVTGGYTWNTLPITTWDSWPSVEYDSSFWTNYSSNPAFFKGDFKVYSLTGGPEASSFTTGSYGAESRLSTMRRVTLRYLKTPETATMTNYYQDRHGGVWTDGVTTTESNGRFDVLKSAPWHKVKFSFTGDYELSSVTAEISDGGVV